MIRMSRMDMYGCAEMDSKSLYTTVSSYEQGLIPWCEYVEFAYSSLVIAAAMHYPCPEDVPTEWWEKEMTYFRGIDDESDNSK